MEIYIGIDDTDNLETRGTGHNARMLGQSLETAGLLRLRSVTRHQLLVDRRIPYTSHNSSASLTGLTDVAPDVLVRHCRDFLLATSAHDSDAGLCVATVEEISPALMEFGLRAKQRILTIEDAFNAIRGTSIYLDGYLNARIGLIGSLAAVALRAAGNDGRLLWTRNLRETTGSFAVRELLDQVDIDRAVEKDLQPVDPRAIIHIDEWCRPVMIEGMITLIAEKIDNITPYEYKSASKEYIKSITE